MKQGWISPEDVKRLAEPMLKNQYGQHLIKIANLQEKDE